MLLFAAMRMEAFSFVNNKQSEEKYNQKYFLKILKFRMNAQTYFFKIFI